jgi:endonuclease/exonuclease/phosphatase (EEP) superfamily protein YafD
MDDGTEPATPPTDLPARTDPGRSGARLTAACVTLALVHPAAVALSRWVWVADLLSHFQDVAAVVSALAAVIVARRRPRLAVACGLLAGLQVVPLLRYSGDNPVRPAGAAAERLRLVAVNVLHDNVRFDDLARLLRSERPDIVGLVEYSQAWEDSLAEFRVEYPYRVAYAEGASGIALWFRRQPLRIDPPEWLAGRGNPSIHAVFEFAGELRHVWIVHPTSPFYRFPTAGNAEIAALARRVAEVGGSRVVMGDMNSTDGSLLFGDFLRTSGLRDSRLGFGRQTSWPSDRPYRIAIDHAFVSDDLAVVDRRLGHDVGSDHFPLILDLAPAARKEKTQPAQASSASR